MIKDDKGHLLRGIRLGEVVVWELFRATRTSLAYDRLTLAGEKPVLTNDSMMSRSYKCQAFDSRFGISNP